MNVVDGAGGGGPDLMKAPPSLCSFYFNIGKKLFMGHPTLVRRVELIIILDGVYFFTVQFFWPFSLLAVFFFTFHWQWNASMSTLHFLSHSFLLHCVLYFSFVTIIVLLYHSLGVSYNNLQVVINSYYNTTYF